MKKLLFYITSVVVIFCTNSIITQAQKSIIPKHLKIKKVDWRGGELAFHVEDVIQLVRFFDTKDGIKGCISNVNTGNLKITGHENIVLHKLLLNATILAELNDMGYNLEVDGKPIILQTPESPLVEFAPEDCLDCQEILKINNQEMELLMNGIPGNEEGTKTTNFNLGATNEFGNSNNNDMFLSDPNLNIDSLKRLINGDPDKLNVVEENSENSPDSPPVSKPK